MPGNKKTCAGTGRNCIGGDSSGEDSRRPGARGLGFRLRPGSRGQGSEGLGGWERTGQVPVSVLWAASRGSEVLIQRLLPQREGGKVPAPREELWADHPATWLFGHSRDVGSRQEFRHGRFSSFLPHEPGGLRCLHGQPMLKWQQSPSLQCEWNGLVLGPRMPAKSKP